MPIPFIVALILITATVLLFMLAKRRLYRRLVSKLIFPYSHATHIHRDEAGEAFEERMLLHYGTDHTPTLIGRLWLDGDGKLWRITFGYGADVAVHRPAHAGLLWTLSCWLFPG